MAKFNTLFARSEDIDDPRHNRVGDVIWAQLPDQNPVVNEVESFLKVKENQHHGGSITVSGTVVPGVDYAMLTRASEVLESGTVPNLILGSTLESTAGLTWRSTPKSSPNLERIGVSEIGLKCLFMSYTAVCLEIGAISASFQDWGSRTSEHEQLRISLTTWARKSSFSFKSYAGMPSGPETLAGLRAVTFFRKQSNRWRIGVVHIIWGFRMQRREGVHRGEELVVNGVSKGRKTRVRPWVNMFQD